MKRIVSDPEAFRIIARPSRKKGHHDHSSHSLRHHGCVGSGNRPFCIPSLFTKGLLEDVSAEAEKYKKGFAEGAFSLMSASTAVVGLPQDTGPLVYYYNAKEFERLGVAEPTTKDELLEAAKKAKADGKFALSFQTDEAQYGLAGQTKALVDGTLIGTIDAAWEAALLADSLKDSDGKGAWKVAQLPTFGAEAMTGPDGGSGVAVMKGSKIIEAAMKFKDWFNRQIADLATQGRVVAATGDVSTPDCLKEFFSGQEVMQELATANDRMSTEFIYMPT